MASYTRILRPNGESSFGEVPEIDSKGVLIPSGNIYLKFGKHIGPNRGFGAEHIWFEHAKEMEKVGFTTKGEVAAYVETIVCQGSSIHCEFAQLGGYQRLTILRSSNGTAILEYKGQYPNGHYSVVTAFSGNKKHGPKIGTVL